jgi:hypothetical protein
MQREIVLFSPPIVSMIYQIDNSTKSPDNAMSKQDQICLRFDTQNRKFSDGLGSASANLYMASQL